MHERRTSKTKRRAQQTDRRRAAAEPLQYKGEETTTKEKPRVTRGLSLTDHEEAEPARQRKAARAKKHGP